MTANTKSVLYKMWAVIATFALVVLSFPALATTAAAQTQEPTEPQIVDYLDSIVTAYPNATLGNLTFDANGNLSGVDGTGYVLDAPTPPLTGEGGEFTIPDPVASIDRDTPILYQYQITNPADSGQVFENPYVFAMGVQEEALVVPCSTYTMVDGAVVQTPVTSINPGDSVTCFYAVDAFITQFVDPTMSGPVPVLPYVLSLVLPEGETPDSVPLSQANSTAVYIAGFGAFDISALTESTITYQVNGQDATVFPGIDIAPPEEEHTDPAIHTITYTNNLDRPITLNEVRLEVPERNIYANLLDGDFPLSAVPSYPYPSMNADASCVRADEEVETVFEKGGTLDVGETITCTWHDRYNDQLDQGLFYSPNVQISGTYAEYDYIIFDNVDAYYYVSPWGLSLEKYINGQRADGFPYTISPGEELKFDFVVTNWSTSAVTDIIVHDSAFGEIECPQNALPPVDPETDSPTDSITCTYTTFAPEGNVLHINEAHATGVAVGTVAEDYPYSYQTHISAGIPLSSITAVARAYSIALPTLEKTAGEPIDTNGNGYIDAGDEIPYTISVVFNNEPLTMEDLYPSDSVNQFAPSPSRLPIALPMQGGTVTLGGAAIALQFLGELTFPEMPLTCIATAEVDGEIHQIEIEPGKPLTFTSTDVVWDEELQEYVEVQVEHPVPLTAGISIECTGNAEITTEHISNCEVANTARLVYSYPRQVSSEEIPYFGPAFPMQDSDAYSVIEWVEVILEDTETVQLPCASGLETTKYVNDANPDAPTGLTVDGQDSDANAAPGVTIPTGSLMEFSYLVTNTGDQPVTDVAVADDQGVAVTCPATELNPGASMVCRGSATASEVGGTLYTNVGTATGTSYVGDPLTASDPANTTTELSTQLDIIKTVNGEDANEAPGIVVVSGSLMSFEVVVTNNGNAPLTNVVVTDNVIPADQWTCDPASGGTLEVGASMTCTATLDAPAEGGVQHTNIATVTATDNNGNPVTNDDPANATTIASPEISVIKLVNGEDANTAPGVEVEVGSEMAFEFTVTNTGNVALRDVTLTDDTIPVEAISCPATTLGVGESMVCTATLTAPKNGGVQHTNTATATGTDADGTTVTDDDPANAVTPVESSITIVKYINGDDANEAPGVTVEVGSDMLISYDVTNTGNAPLTNVTVTDDHEIQNLVCPTTELAAGESMTCTATLVAPATGNALHTNVGTVTGTDVTGETVTDDDPANATTTLTKGLEITKYINGDDANEIPGVQVEVGSDMTITYEVVNNGNATMTDVVVTDNVVPADAISCPATELAAGESMTCTATFPAPESGGVQHTNIGTVTGTAVDGTTITDADPANAWTELVSDISLIKYINGDDANEAPGVLVEVGSDMTVTFDVTNNGNATVTQIALTDDVITEAIVCPATELAPGETMTCTTTYPAPAEGGVQHTNNATVTAVDNAGNPLTDTDPANAHTELTADLNLVKTINGDDANEAPGVEVEVGSDMAVEFIVTNSGNATVNNIVVVDDTITEGIVCPATELAPGETMTCTATYPAPSEGGVQHTNIGVVTGDAPDGSPLTDADPANAHTPLTTDLSLIKYINGEDANEAPGVEVEVNSEMSVEFVVTNNGNATVTDIVVTDNVITEGIECPATELAPGETMTCTTTWTAPATGGVQHTNVGTVTGTANDGTPLEDSDPANAITILVSDLDLTKFINGEDANEAPGVMVEVGSDMVVTFVVTNTGNATVSDIVVTDDVIASEAIACPATELPAGESMTCLATFPAPSEGNVLHTNIATVTGTDVAGNPLTDDDPANATTTLVSGLDIVKYINGDDANEMPGVEVEVGSDMEITYEVTNTGNATLTSVVVTDDKVATEAITCPATELAAGETMTCTATFPAPSEGGAQHTNVGTVTGTAPDGTTLTDADPANAHTPLTTDLNLVKYINGDNANEAPGVKVEVGSDMAVEFVVTNNGNATVTDIVVTDDTITETIICPATELAPGESMTCTIVIPAPDQGNIQHTNVGTVTGVAVDGTELTDDDPANAWTEASPAIDVVKTVNGEDANEAPGVEVEAGSTMEFEFLVTNTGNATLNDVTVADDVIPAENIVCPATTLTPGEFFTCTATLVAPDQGGVQHTNTATVTGTDGAGATVMDDDPANAVTALVNDLSLVKTINGDDANELPGVLVEVGSDMAVEFIVTNNGNATVTNIVVTDDTITEGITCPVTELAPGETMTCTATFPAPAEGGMQHTNIATVTGTASDGSILTDLDPANAHTELVSDLTLVKTINGEDANEAPGVEVAVGSDMTVAFIVTNNGNAVVKDIVVTDNVITENIVCPATELAPGESMTCTVVIPAPDKGNVQHTNIGTVKGVAVDGTELTDDDPANAITTVERGLAIVKSINGDDANTAPGVSVEAGSDMAVTFVVTNNSNVTVTDIVVTDDVIPAEDIICEVNELAPGESMTCTATLKAPVNGGVQHTNIATVTGMAEGVEVSDSDPANAHTIIESSIQIIKYVNDEDANEAPGVIVEKGSTLNFTFKVTNTGNSVLTDVKVTDDVIEMITCPETTLEPGESMTCTATLSAPDEFDTQHTNTATVTGTDPDGVKVMDEDMANAKTETAPDETKPTPEPEKPGVVTGGDPTVPTNVLGLAFLGMAAAAAAGLLIRRNLKKSTE